MAKAVGRVGWHWRWMLKVVVSTLLGVALLSASCGPPGLRSNGVRGAWCLDSLVASPGRGVRLVAGDGAWAMVRPGAPLRVAGFRDAARYQFNGGYWTVPGRDWIDLEAGTTLRFTGRTEDQLLYLARELPGPVGTTLLPGAMLRPTRFTRDGAVVELPIAFGSENARPEVRLACRDLRIEPTTEAEAARWRDGRDLRFDAEAGVTMEAGGERARLVDRGEGTFARVLGDPSAEQVEIEVIHRGVRFRAHVEQARIGGLIGREVPDDPDEPSGCERVLRSGATIYTQPVVAGQRPVVKQWPVVTLRRDAKAVVSDWFAPWVMVRLMNPDPDILVVRGYARTRDLAPETPSGGCASHRRARGVHSVLRAPYGGSGHQARTWAGATPMLSAEPEPPTPGG